MPIKSTEMSIAGFKKKKTSMLMFFFFGGVVGGGGGGGRPGIEEPELLRMR